MSWPRCPTIPRTRPARGLCGHDQPLGREGAPDVSLWIVTNGYWGYGRTGALVEAESEDEAKRVAVDCLRTDPQAKDEGAEWTVDLVANQISLPYLGEFA